MHFLCHHNAAPKEVWIRLSILWMPLACGMHSLLPWKSKDHSIQCESRIAASFRFATQPCSTYFQLTGHREEHPGLYSECTKHRFRSLQCRKSAERRRFRKPPEYTCTTLRDCMPYNTSVNSVYRKSYRRVPPNARLNLDRGMIHVGKEGPMTRVRGKSPDSWSKCWKIRPNSRIMWQA